MILTIQDQLSTPVVVVVVGLVAAGLLLTDLVRSELLEPRAVGRLYLISGVVMTVAFVALAALRFVTLGS